MEKERKRITKEIVLHFDCISDHLVFDNLQTLSLAMGTKSVAGNYNYYGIEKKGREFYVKLKTVEERLEKKKKELEKLKEDIELMGNIIKVAKGSK